MGYNAIEIDGEMKLDLSEDTVTEETLPEGITAHDATGEPIVGKMKFVKSVNGKNGEVTLDAADVGADKTGTAATAVNEHNIQTDAHNDMRLELKRLAGIINDILDSEDPTLDEMHEVVAYIKSNKTLIEAITDAKVNVADIIDNLTTNVTDKPLSAAQGVALKGLISALDANIDARLDKGVGLEIVTTTGSSTAYTATVSSIKQLKAGVGFIMKPHVTNTSTSATLNVNSLGAIQIRRRLASNPSYYYEVNASMLKVGKAYHVIYDGQAWVLVDSPKVAPSDLSATVPITKGGTGATTAAAALTNLGAQAASDDTLETTDKTVVGAINELNAKTIDKIQYIDTYLTSKNENVTKTAAGITWVTQGAVDGNNQIQMSQRVPIVAGDNVTFAVDEENQVVKINAEGGGGSVGGSNNITFDKEYGIKGYYEDEEIWLIRQSALETVMINQGGYDVYICGDETDIEGELKVHSDSHFLGDIGCQKNIYIDGNARVEGNLTDGTNSVTIAQIANAISKWSSITNAEEATF